MKLESLKNEKFKTLASSSLLLVRGGGDTGANKVLLYAISRQPPHATDAGGGGANYSTNVESRYRSWTSDFINDDGSVCYWGESYSTVYS